MLAGNVIFWIGVSVASLLALWLAWRGFIGKSTQGRPRCLKCWYDMTGAPSLTCPECGVTAKNPKQQRRRKRRLKSAVAGLLLATLLVTYCVQVVSRMSRFGESLDTGAIPTTALIARCAFGTDPKLDQQLLHRTFNPNGRILTGSTWENWLLAHALFRRINKETLPSDRLFLLLHMSKANATARGLLLRVIAEHPNEKFRLSAAWYLSEVNPALANDPDFRRALFVAGEQDVSGAFVRAILEPLAKYSILKKLSDEDLVQELKVILPKADNNLLDVYLREVVARKLDVCLPAIRDQSTGDNATRTILIRTAIARLEKEPDPISLRLLPHDDLPDFFWLEIRLADRKSAELPLGWPDKPAKLVFPMLVKTISSNGHTTQSSEGSNLIDVVVLRREMPIRLLIHPYNLPRRCTVSVRLDGEINWQLSLPQEAGGLFPVSNQMQVDLPDDLKRP
jgi:hypothetical protein